MKLAAARRWFAAPLVLALLAGPGVGSAFAAAPAMDPPAASAAALADQSWSQARAGKGDLALSSLKSLVAAGNAEAAAELRAELVLLEKNIAAREALRSTRTQEVNKEIAETLALEPTPVNLSKALKQAVELQTLATDPTGVVARADVQKLIRAAADAARTCEAQGDWLMASELFQRLDTLLDEEAIFKSDIQRLINRLGMIRMYNPQRLWELRNERRKFDNLPPLPPFNAVGEDFKDRLKGVNTAVVLSALGRAAELNVERVSLRKLLQGGLENIKVMINTPDLRKAFPGLAQPGVTDQMSAWIDARLNDLQVGKEPNRFGMADLLEELLRMTARLGQLPEAAVVHEFGNGAFAELDEYSNIIWPDEVTRFQRMTAASFIGVGVQIKLDEETQLIRVVTPLEGTPAMRAGVKAGDLIKQIDGKSAVGMSLDQAVEQITGKADSNVTLLMERDGQEIEFTLKRSKIPLVSVKGWKRTGAKDRDWDWFIDRVNGIGYIRLTGFNEDSTRDILAAIDSMKKTGLRGLILDLRFNPGGLLNQAVSISNLFIADGTIVSTEAAGGVPHEVQSAEPGRARLRGVPVAVLINQSSASASEIVSGAIKHYADQGQVDAVVIGERSFGKGSVQNVLQLSTTSMLKLTTQYYKLPSGQIIHRRDGAKTWGVEPHLTVSMLPKQVTDAIELRQDADVATDPANPPQIRPAKPGDPPRGVADPDRLLAEGMDLQLQTALVFLQAKALAARSGDVKNAQRVPAGNPG